MDPRGLGLGADAVCRCRCDDLFDYILKDGSSHPYTPHDEWFCTKLAGHVGIACPQCALVENDSGGCYFGSRIEGGVVKAHWYERVARGDLEVNVCAPVLSRIFAFDCFVFNDDRNLDNYVMRDTDSGWGLLAIDFSRAWTYHGFPPSSLPFKPSAGTLASYRELTQIIGPFLDMAAVSDVLDRLTSIPASVIERIIKEHPEEWLPQSMREAICAWWDSPERLKRVEGIKKGIGNGSHL